MLVIATQDFPLDLFKADCNRRTSEVGALQPGEHRIRRHRFNAIRESLLERMVVESDVGRADASTQTGERAELQCSRPVVA